MGCPRRTPAAATSPPGRAPLDIAEVFRAHGEDYRRRHALTREQDQVMRAITRCRTEALGGHVDVCDACGFTVPVFNSCRNRHCPKCQSLDQARWIEARMERLLPTHYFHVVFTLPSELRPLARANRELVFNALFAAASETLLALGWDPERLGAQLGFTAVLHTWTRELTFHPHLHCVVTGGGLTADGTRWLTARRRYLFPLRVMAALFRKRLLGKLRQLYKKGLLRLERGCAALGDPRAFNALVDRLFEKRWVVYAKRPFGDTEAVFRYLGRYTHRVGISNQRLRAITHDTVCFATKNGNAITLSHEEFIRRFLDHVLPPGFTKIRHFGLLAGANVKGRLDTARVRLEASMPTATVPPAAPAPAATDVMLDEPTWQELVLALTGVDPRICPRCGVGRMQRHPIDSIPHAATFGVLEPGLDTS